MNARQISNQKYAKKLKMQVLTHYGGSPPKCDCCGDSNTEFLSIDHINGGGNQHRKELGLGRAGGYDFYMWLIKNNYPDGFRVLCFNCNHSLGAYGYCPHHKDIRVQPKIEESRFDW